MYNIILYIKGRFFLNLIIFREYILLELFFTRSYFDDCGHRKTSSSQWISQARFFLARRVALLSFVVLQQIHALNRKGKGARIAEGEFRTVSVYGTDRTESSRRLSINVKAHTYTCLATHIEYILSLLRAVRTRTHAYVTPTRTGHRPGIRQRG